jgi:hypothetical protein
MSIADALFPLNESEQEAIVEVIGLAGLNCVEDVILVYCFKKRFYDGQPSIPQLNKKFVEIREHLSALTELLDEAQLRDYLFVIADEYFSGDGGKQFIGKITPFINKTPRLHIHDALEKLDKVCEASIKKQKPGKGRPKGQKDDAVHYLLNNLCRCCERAKGGPLSTKQSNKLQRLVAILNKPLGLGGTRPGTTRKVIEERNKRREELLKNK